MNDSKFTGGLLGYIGITILSLILSICTLFLATPWVVTMKQRWICKHTYVDGEQLTFTGSGFSLIKHYIVWLFLTFITIGIYGFWLSIKLKQWKCSNTHFKC